MPGELKDIATIIMGQSPAGHLVSDDPSTGLPLLNGPSEFGDSHPIPVQWTRDAPRIAEPGDLLFCVRGSTTGRMNWADQRYAVGRGIAAIRPNKPNTADAMRGLIEAQLPALLQAATGSTFPNVSRDQLTELPLQLGEDVSLPTISAFIAFIREKIDLNRQMAATLEDMARALFKSWFVDFDPVRAKAEGRDTGLPADIAALFPDSFDDDLLPKGWTWGTPESLVEVNPTTRIDRANKAPYIDMAALPTQGHRIKSAVSRAVGSGARFRNGDTLLARITPCLENGKTAFVDCLDDDDVAWGSTEFIVMRPLAAIPEPLAYIIARDDSFRSHMIASMSGTSGRQRAPAEAIGRWTMAIPTEAVILAWGDAVTPMFDGIKVKSLETEQLTELRDTLLPELLSGELQVADAESAIAAA